MTLSEAIRLGAMLHPQCFEWLEGKDHGGVTVETCALGAAKVAGYPIRDLDRWSQAAVITCPACGISWWGGLGRCLYGAIEHLNDVHRWTREAIADFVATVEPPEAADAVAGAVVMTLEPTIRA